MSAPLHQEEIAAVMERLQQIQRDREGVAMFLVFEDRVTAGAAVATGPDRNGPALAQLAEVYRSVLVNTPDPISEFEVAQILEVLAAAHFTECPA